jgi:peptidoglycan/LPS O-acetylase OafA/YrhL
MTQMTLPAVEGWRGLAALMVVIAHFVPPLGLQGWGVSFAFTGVDLFFVLSGFVFAPHILGRRERLAGFALRRAFRILPAYYLALAFYGGVALYEGRPAPIVEHALFLHLSSPELAFALNPAFWSLVPEVEFYLVLPLIAMLGGGWRLAALCAAALALRLWLGHDMSRNDPNTAYILIHHLPGMLIEFLLGCGAWLLSNRVQSKVSRLTLITIGIGAWSAAANWFWVVGGDLGADASALKGQPGLLAAAAFACALAGSAHLRLSAEVSHFAVWAGSLSYGVYLWHHAAWWLVHQFTDQASGMSAGLALIVCLGIAWATYQLVEKPMRSFGRMLAGSASPRA